ncbi:MAG: hypothetical protein K2J99_06795 [Lachnospiraceae bacterium]|nr:hypothetical protein [Lachnospiraceae bacterium]
MKKKRFYQILILTTLIIAVFCILVINKKIRITPIFAGGFEVRGVDVSHYQGTIDWEKLAGQDLDFAFIKATEGSGHVDECFADNWQEAGKTDLYIGAYHFFSFDSDGEKQAELYIDTVGSLDGKIAPAVDVEFYGDKKSNPPQKDELVSELKKMLETLEEHYQAKPVIYTTYKVYHEYIKGEFDEYPLWIRNVYYQPVFTAGNKWTFWQYTDTAVLEGYQGTEKYIDMNVFRRTREELEKLIVRGEGAGLSSEEAGFEDADNSLPDDEEESVEKKIEKEFTAGHCNLVYDGGWMQVYSYLGMKNALYVLTPESKTVIYPVQNFWVDQEQESVWILEDNEELQIRRMDLRQDHFLEDTLILDAEAMEALIADTYGLFMEEERAVFWDSYAGLSGSEENGQISLGGIMSGVYKETNEEFEIVYEIDRESGEVSAKGYLQNLGLHPLYQEFLFNNLTVNNLFAGNETKLGKNLSFFDDKNYLSESGDFQKQFALVDVDEDGRDEMLFRLKQTDGTEELVYVLAEEKDMLICRDIVRTGSAYGSDNKEETENFKEGMIRWFDCASFLEIPAENCKDYKSREEVFASVEEGDFTVVARKYADPDIIIEELEMAYESDGDSRRIERCDIDGDGFDELLLLSKYEFEDYERIGFVLDYRNGRAICTYLDWCDGNEWLLLGNEGKLIHCSSSGSCDYYGLMECTLNARGIKDIDYTGYGIEVFGIYEPVESGLWWWEGQQPEITQRGIYFAKVRPKNAEEIEDAGTADGWVKKLISKEQFLEEYAELTGEDFALCVDLERAGIIVADMKAGGFCLGYTDKDWFLRDYDFEGKEPFYQYLDENEELQLELYYDERTGKGCGIRYYPEDNRTPQGFHFDNSAVESVDAEFLQERLNADPYELLARDGTDLSKDEWIEDYEENIEYTNDGRPKYFVSHGWITYFGEEHELQKLLEIEFTYREDGTLRRRDYAHNTGALETWNSVMHSFYDTQERLLYEDCYITHGSMDYYYIYQDEEEIPSYCLALDHDLGWIHAEMMSVHDLVEDENENLLSNIPLVSKLPRGRA